MANIKTALRCNHVNLFNQQQSSAFQVTHPHRKRNGIVLWKIQQKQTCLT